MSFLLSLGQSFFSGISSIATGVTSDVVSVANGINNAFTVLTQFIQQLPSELLNFFQSVGGALIGFGHTFGTYIWDGMQRIASSLSSVMAPIERGLETIGSAIMNALATLWNDLKAFASNIFNTVYSAISDIISFIQPVFNDVKNLMVSAYNFLSTVVSDIYSIFTTIANFFLDMPTFFQNIASFLNNLFTDPGNQPNLLTMIPNVIASEVSRIAGAIPEVIAYNSYMKLLPEIVKGISSFPIFGNSSTGILRGILGKALLLVGSPFLTAIISSMTQSIMESFFSSTKTTQTIPRPSQPQIQVPQNLPSTQLPQRSTGTSSVSDLPQLQLPSLTAEEIELQLERPNTTGVFVEDVIGMGTPGGGTAKLVSGYVNFQNALQEFQDVFEIVPNFFMKLIESSQFEFSQNMTVDISLTLLENIYQIQQTIEIVPSVDATAIILPPDIAFCNPNNVPQPSESASVSSNSINASATVQVQESLCIPPYDLLADTVTEFFGVISGLLQNLEDIIAETLQIQSGIPYQTNLSDIITEAIQFAFGIPFSTSLTDGVSLTVGFAPIPPSPESYTYYTPVDVPVTYTISQVGSASYSGTLNYSVGGS
jgi:predicted PurR-regulated permease PerM